MRWAAPRIPLYTVAVSDVRYVALVYTIELLLAMLLLRNTPAQRVL